jgi:probable rRNA maturation factor
VKGGPRVLGVANRHSRLRIDRRALAKAVGRLDAAARAFKGGCPAGELSLAFVADSDLARLHARYLGDASPTDVITFGGDAAHGVAGEICVSADAAVRRVGTASVALSRELTLYWVHGWLHLAGYDDRTAASRRAMRAAEARALRLLERSGAIPRFKLA